MHHPVTRAALSLAVFWVYLYLFSLFLHENVNRFTAQLGELQLFEESATCCGSNLCLLALTPRPPLPQPPRSRTTKRLYEDRIGIIVARDFFSAFGRFDGLCHHHFLNH